MSKLCPHRAYLRVLFAVIVASATSACVLDAASEPAPVEEDALPGATIKPNCPNGCPGSIGTGAVSVQSTSADAGDASNFAR